MSVERFRSVCNQVKALLREIPSPEPAIDENRPIREILEARAAQLPQLREAERILTEALDEFVLHPYLLDWRAEVRMRMTDGKAEGLATDEAKADLKLALQVAPDYLLPQLRLADLTYLHLDDDEEAANLFATSLDKMESFICSCAAGQAEALADADRKAEAQAVLARWQLVFPNSERLMAAANHLNPRFRSVMTRVRSRCRKLRLRRCSNRVVVGLQ